MFLEHFGLIEQPFGVTPDPRFLHMGKKHREALASLVYGTETNRGFLALIAAPGMGKTSLLYQYLEGLRGKARTAFVFQTDCNAHDFLRHILTDMGLDPTGRDTAAMHAMLNEELTREMRAGRRFVLVIDEAQNLTEDVLESVRLLSNFETPWMKLMQIVIAGQPQLADRLTRPCLAQLRQRISSVIRIEPLGTDEVNTYIDHRLWVAGYSGAPLFTVGARLAIAKHSGGIPRNINTLCFNSMSVALGQGLKQVDAKMVQEAASDVEMESLVQTRAKAARVVVSPKPAQRGPALTFAPSAMNGSAGTYAFAAFCVAMLCATFTWIGWERGMHMSPFAGVSKSVHVAAQRAGDFFVREEARFAEFSHELLQRGDGSGSGDSANAQATANSEPEPVDFAVASQAAPQVAPGDRLTASVVPDDDEFRVPKPAPVAPTVTAPPPAAVASDVARLTRLTPARPAPSPRNSVPAGYSQDDRILTVEIEADATVRQICRQYVGKDDHWAVLETYALNPGLNSEGILRKGDRIQLPLYLRDDFEARRTLAERDPSKNEQEAKP
jgi:general secretion pathway protein A